VSSATEPPGPSLPRAARIDLDRLARNFQAVRAFARRPVMPVVKADAYGHGSVFVARRLEREGAAMLAVAALDEGVELRQAGVRLPIVVLVSCEPREWKALREHSLTPVVSTPEMARCLLEASPSEEMPAAVHLKIDTGMRRLGLRPEDALDVARRLGDSGRIRFEGLMTHLASADEDARVTEEQLDRFDAVIAELERRGQRPAWVHAANSAGLAFLRPTHTLVRPGLLIYGVAPRPLAPAIDVQPAMTVTARIALVKDVQTGEAVSYGGRWIAKRRSRIATVPIGYADGVPRTDAMLRNGCLVVRGKRAPVAGTVCMDLTMLDVSEIPEASEGDLVTLLGQEPDAWELSQWAGTTAWQALTAIGGRVTRQYVENGRVIGAASRFSVRRSEAS
jgi:alanine racemase